MRVGTTLGRHLAGDHHQIRLKPRENLGGLIERSEYLDTADVLVAKEAVIVKQAHNDAPIRVGTDRPDQFATEGAVTKSGTIDNRANRIRRAGKITTVQRIEEVPHDSPEDARQDEAEDGE